MIRDKVHPLMARHISQNSEKAKHVSDVKAKNWQDVFRDEHFYCEWDGKRIAYVFSSGSDRLVFSCDLSVKDKFYERFAMIYNTFPGEKRTLQLS